MPPILRQWAPLLHLVPCSLIYILISRCAVWGRNKFLEPNIFCLDCNHNHYGNTEEKETSHFIGFNHIIEGKNKEDATKRDQCCHKQFFIRPFRKGMIQPFSI